MRTKIPTSMNRTLTFFLAAAILLASGCGRSNSNLRRDQKNYEVVEEGQASGVSSTISAPGEVEAPVLPMTGTNADTTTAFTLPNTSTTTPTAPPGTIAGTFPSTTPPPPPRPRPAAPAPAPPPPTDTATPPPPPADTTQPQEEPPKTDTQPPPTNTNPPRILSTS